MREIKISERKGKELFYVPEKCIGCGTCTNVCPSDAIVIGSVGAVARGELDKNFIEITDDCITCGLCAKACPTGALLWKVEGNVSMEEGYISTALPPTTVNENCVYCGLCESVCPQGCIDVERWFNDDGEARVEGKVNIDQECCVHCGWCAAVCPVNAIEVEKPFEGEWKWDGDTCQGCRTCVDTCPVSALFTPGREVGEIVDNIAHRPDVCIYCGACAVSCPVGAIDVVKTAVVPHIDKYSAIEKKILNVSPPTPLLTSVLKTDEDACLGCNNCVIVCPVNALSSPELASAHLYEEKRRTC